MASAARKDRGAGQLPTELGLMIPPTPATLIGAYVLGERIGSGSFATVFKGHHRETFKSRQTAEGEDERADQDGGLPGRYSLRYASDGMPVLVAIKSVDRSRLDHRLADNLESEIRILRTLRHPNIVALWGTEKTDKQIHLLMEYCELGDLSDFIKKKGLVGPAANRQRSAGGEPSKNLYEGPWGGLDEPVARWFLGQLGSALTFLRTHNLIHRDLKPQNLLLSSRHGTYASNVTLSQSFSLPLPTLKLADFGFARLLPSMSLASTLCGSPLYMAPEILRHERYDAKADLWSVGIVLYEMIAGRVPYRARNHVELLKRIESGKSGAVKWPNDPSTSNAATDDKIGTDLKDLVRRLLKRDPTERMTFDEFFSHAAIVGSEGFSGRVDGAGEISEPVRIEEDNAGAPSDPNAAISSKKHVVVPRRASTSLAEERASLSRGLAQLVPTRKPARTSSESDTQSPPSVETPTSGSAPTSAPIAASKPVPVPMTDSSDDYQAHHPPSAPNDLPFAFPVANNMLMFGPIGVPSSSLDREDAFPEELECQHARSPMPSPSAGFAGLGALHRNMSAPKNIVTAHYRRASPMEGPDGEQQDQRLPPPARSDDTLAHIPLRRGSQGTLGLGEAVMPVTDNVKGVVSAASAMRRGSSGNITKEPTKAVSTDDIAVAEENFPEPAGYIINHGDDDLPPRHGHRTPSAQGVAIPRGQGPDTLYVDNAASPSSQSRSPRASSSSRTSTHEARSFNYGRGRGSEPPQDPDEYVVISKRAVEVEWLAEEVENYARSPRSQPSSMDRVPHFLAATRPKSVQQEPIGLSPGSNRGEASHGMPVRTASNSGLLSSQDEGHPIVFRLGRILDRGRALQRLADEYLADGGFLDAATAEIPLQLYLHALHVLQKGVDTARVGFDTFRYAQSFAAASSPYGTTPPSSTPPGRAGRMLYEGMRNSPVGGDSQTSVGKDVSGDVNKLAELVRLTRDGFTLCLEGAERCRRMVEIAEATTTGDSLGPETVAVEKVVYERVLELARSAAVTELSVGKGHPTLGDVLLDCEAAYNRGIVLLEALLDEADAERYGAAMPLWDTTQGSVTWALTDDDRRMVTEFLASLHMRVAALKIKMMMS